MPLSVSALPFDKLIVVPVPVNPLLPDKVTL